jgi:CRISPR/Cas system-associated endonuclease Cas1
MVERIILDGFGSYLGMKRGCFVVKDREGEEQRYPLRALACPDIWGYMVLNTIIIIKA